MSEVVGVGLRRRRRGAEAERLVLEFQRSGLTRRDFCAEHGLSVGTLDNYRRRFGVGCKRPEKVAATAGRMLPVEFVNEDAATQSPASRNSCSLSIELENGRRIDVGDGFDAPTLERLVLLLEKA
jgi:hypothetical protein